MVHSFTLTDADRDAISAAVFAAEGRTAGEIVTIMADRSDSYHDVALWWSAFAAFLALAVLGLFAPFYLDLVDRLIGSWHSEWSTGQVLGLALAVVVLKFIGTYLILLWRPLRLALVPGPLKHRRVRARAVTNFKIGAERRTHGRTGVLIYLSLAEHRAEIVADAAIAAKVSPDVWGEAMAQLIGEIRAGRAGQGLVLAIAAVGDVLAQHFPRDANDVNELPDRLIEV